MLKESQDDSFSTLLEANFQKTISITIEHYCPAPSYINEGAYFIVVQLSLCYSIAPQLFYKLHKM